MLFKKVLISSDIRIRIFTEIEVPGVKPLKLMNIIVPPQHILPSPGVYPNFHLSLHMRLPSVAQIVGYVAWA